MKKFSIILIIAGFTFFAFNAYSIPPAKVVSGKSTPVYASAKKASPQDARGEQIYNDKCFKCHQTTGMGIPGVFPPLKGSDFLKSAAKRKLLEQVLQGSSETYTVNGMSYSTPMPPQVDNVNDALAVVNYVLNAWGNNYGHATAADAKGLKAKPAQ